MDISEAREYVVGMRASTDALAGIFTAPRATLNAAITDLAPALARKLAGDGAKAVIADIHSMATVGTGSGIAIAGAFIQYIQRFVGWLKGEFESAGEQTAYNYGAAQANLLSWVAMQGRSDFRVAELPGYNAHGGTPDVPGFYLFVRPTQGSKNDRSDFYGDPLIPQYDPLLKAAGYSPVAEGDVVTMGGACQDAVKLLAGDVCDGINGAGRQVFWPILFPLYSPARLWGWYSRFGEPIPGIALAANTLATLTPQHIRTRDAEVERAWRALNWAVQTEYPTAIRQAGGWVLPGAAPKTPRFKLADANLALARIRQFKRVRDALITAKNEPVTPKWARDMMKANPDFSKPPRQGRADDDEPETTETASSTSGGGALLAVAIGALVMRRRGKKR